MHLRKRTPARSATIVTLVLNLWVGSIAAAEWQYLKHTRIHWRAYDEAAFFSDEKRTNE